MNEKIVDVKSIEYGSYFVITGVTKKKRLLIAQPEVEKLFGWEKDVFRKKTTSKSFKQFAGEDFNIGKRKLCNTYHASANTNFIYFEDFLVLLKWQMKEGNQQAINLAIAGFADSFSTFAYKEFGIDFTEKQRQKELTVREKGIITRRTLTDAIKEYLERNECSENYSKYIYSNVSDALNKYIFGKKAKELRVAWECEQLREKMTDEELIIVELVEFYAMQLIDEDNVEPLTAMKESLVTLRARRTLRKDKSVLE